MRSSAIQPYMRGGNRRTKYIIWPYPTASRNTMGTLNKVWTDQNVEGKQKDVKAQDYSDRKITM